MPARDAHGRPLPAGHADAVEPVPEQALPPERALDLAQALLDEGRPFFAHEVLEAVWKASPADEREHWQGLTQLCVAVTHLQRGNVEGAITLLRRGGSHLTGRLAAWAEAEAARLAAGDLRAPQLRLRDS
jgi:hypothetical protein